MVIQSQGDPVALLPRAPERHSAGAQHHDLTFKRDQGGLGDSTPEATVKEALYRYL